MPRNICFHSFRGGTGKTTLVANLGVALARLGMRVGIVDFDLKSPAMQLLMRISSDDIRWKLNDYLWRRCNAKDVVLDISERFGLIEGALFFVPASLNFDDIVKIIEDGYEASLFSRFVNAIADDFNLDCLLLDTHSGMDEDAILSMAVSDTIVEVIRMDEQSLIGAGVSLQVIRKLGKKVRLLANMVAQSAEAAGQTLEERLKAGVLGTIPFLDDVWKIKGEGIFVVDHPNHPFSTIISEMVEKLLEIEPFERKEEKEEPKKAPKESLERRYF